MVAVVLLCLLETPMLSRRMTLFQAGRKQGQHHQVPIVAVDPLRLLPHQKIPDPLRLYLDPLRLLHQRQQQHRQRARCQFRQNHYPQNRSLNGLMIWKISWLTEDSARSGLPKKAGDTKPRAHIIGRVL